MITLNRKQIHKLYEILQEFDSVSKFKVELKDEYLSVTFKLNDTTKSRITFSEKNSNDEL